MKLKFLARIKKLKAKIKKINYEKPNFKDILILFGLIMSGKGLYMIYKPSMFIIVGLFLIFIGWPKDGDN